MKPKRYSQNPIQVRIHNVQEDTLNKIMNDTEYCTRKNIISKSDGFMPSFFATN